MDNSSLSNKVVLITGVTRRAGIGAAIARELAHSGAKVFTAFFRKFDAAQAWGVGEDEPTALIDELNQISEARGLEIDLSTASAPAELVARCIESFGKVDILINNAAHWEAGGLAQTNAAQLDRHYAVNTRAVVLLCAEFVRRTTATSPRRIINITSGQGSAPMPGEIAYVVTKAALDALTLTLSAELAKQNITVNAVDPGATDTGWIAPEHRLELERASVSGRIATPEDTARVVKLLVSDEAAAISGQIIRVLPGALG